MKKIIVKALHAGIKKLPKINKAYDPSFFSETVERTRDSSHKNNYHRRRERKRKKKAPILNYEKIIFR